MSICLKKRYNLYFDMKGGLLENNCIIVARFKEDLEWLNKLVEREMWIERVIIFNKGSDNISFSKESLKKIEIVKKENIGREGGTYLDYIIENYDNFPDKIWFVQGDPFDHSPDFLNLMKYDIVRHYVDKEFQTLTWRYNEMIPPNIDSDHRFYIEKNRIIQYYIDSNTQQTVETHEFHDFAHDEKVNSLKYKTPIPYGNYLHYMCGANGFPQPNNIIPYCWSAIFYVRGSSIRRNGKNSYENLLEMLLSSNNQGGNEGFVLERLWQYILTHETYSDLVSLKKSLGWKYHDLCGFWNSSLMYIAIYDKSYQKHPTRRKAEDRYDSTMIYLNEETGTFEVMKGLYYESTPVLMCPCLNIESAKDILKLQIDFTTKKMDLMRGFENLVSNNLIPTLFWTLQNKKSVRISDNVNIHKYEKEENDNIKCCDDKIELALDKRGAELMVSKSEVS